MGRAPLAGFFVAARAHAASIGVYNFYRMAERGHFVDLWGSQGNWRVRRPCWPAHEWPSLRGVCPLGLLVLLALGGAQTRKAAAGSSPAAAASSPTLVPAGTLLYLRLETPVGTTSSRLFQPVSAEVIRQVWSASSAAGAMPQVVIPVGAKVRGVIQALIPSSNPSDRAEIMLRFDRLELPGRSPEPIVGHLKEVENARETVQAGGMIVGVLSGEMPVSLLQSALAKLRKAHPQAGGDLQSADRQWLGQSDTSISYPAGTDLVYALDQPLPVEGHFPSAFSPSLPEGLEASVLAALAAAPQRVSSKTGTPGDPINLVFIASQEQIQTAFRLAGWSPAEKINHQSLWDAARAMISDQGYHQAPLSDLYLFGRPEDLAFEKMLNTMAKRHHIRLWRSGSRAPDGRDIWLGASTHDDGIDIHPGVISHAIAPDLDDERSKVGADMGATRTVAAEQLVTPAHPLSRGLTATGGTWKTDGRILVIDFKTASRTLASGQAR